MQSKYQDDGGGAPSTTVTFSLENNVGHNYGNGQLPKTAKFINEAGLPVDTLTKTTDLYGKTSITVRSSDIVSQTGSQPRLLAKWTNNNNEVVEVGSILCDFGAMTSRRGAPDPNDPDDPNWQTNDTGWTCNANILANVDDVTNVKLYLKFEKTPGEWQPVSSHQVRIKVKSIDLKDGSQVTGRSNTNQYVLFIDDSGNETSLISVTTDTEGVAQLNLKAKNRISEIDAIQFMAQDLTQWIE